MWEGEFGEGDWPANHGIESGFRTRSDNYIDGGIIDGGKVYGKAEQEGACKKMLGRQGYLPTWLVTEQWQFRSGLV